MNLHMFQDELSRDVNGGSELVKFYLLVEKKNERETQRILLLFNQRVLNGNDVEFTPKTVALFPFAGRMFVRHVSTGKKQNYVLRIRK